MSFYQFNIIVCFIIEKKRTYTAASSLEIYESLKYGVIENAVADLKNELHEKYSINR